MENINNECELLKNCGFFQKYNKINEVACNMLISMYCTGPRQSECKRKAYRMANGVAPDDSMMPNGKNLNS